MYAYACMRCAVLRYWSPETCQDTRSARQSRAGKRNQAPRRARSSCCNSEAAGQPETRHSSAEVPARGSHIQTNAALPATTSAPPVHLAQLRGAAPCGGCPAGPGRHSAESGAGCAGKVACASAQVSVMLVSRCSSAGASAVPTRTWLRAQASREPLAGGHAQTPYPYTLSHTRALSAAAISTRCGMTGEALALAAFGSASAQRSAATRQVVCRRRPQQQRLITEPGTWSDIGAA